jgi:Na+/H+ antiporter NhaD/arsenite permease-like protein
MNKISFLHYLTHVNLIELFIYLLPVLSLTALIKANSHLKRHVINIEKEKKKRDKKNNLFRIIHIVILISMFGYMMKNEFPQKEYFYKNNMSKRQIRFDKENFLYR